MRAFSLLTAGLVAAAAVAAPAAAGREDHKNKLGGSESQEFACGDDTVWFHGDDQLWPPNHKYAPYTIVAEGDEGEEVGLMTRLTHDEYVTAFLPEDENSAPGDEEVGAGNTVDDARPFYTMDTQETTNEAFHEIRAERSGRGDGRTYTFLIDASFDGQACETIEVEVEVPHDMRSDTAPAKEDKTDSTGPDQDDDTES